MQQRREARFVGGQRQPRQIHARIEHERLVLIARQHLIHDLVAREAARAVGHERERIEHPGDDARAAADHVRLVKLELALARRRQWRQALLQAERRRRQMSGHRSAAMEQHLDGFSSARNSRDECPADPTLIAGTAPGVRKAFWRDCLSRRVVVSCRSSREP